MANSHDWKYYAMQYGAFLVLSISDKLPESYNSESDTADTFFITYSQLGLYLYSLYERGTNPDKCAIRVVHAVSGSPSCSMNGYYIVNAVKNSPLQH